MLGGVALAIAVVPLQWTAPAECPDKAAVSDLIAQHLAEVEPQALDGVAVEASAEATAEGAWRVSVEVRRGEDVRARHLEVSACDDAAEAVALAVALSVGPVVPEPDPEPEAVVVPPPEPEPARLQAETEREPEREAEPERERGLEREPGRAPNVRGFVGAGGGLGFGVLPLGGHLQLRGGILGRRLIAEVGVNHWVRRAVRLDGDPDTGGNVSVTAGELGVGPRFAFGIVELPLVAGAEIGAMRARAVGATRGQTRNVVWAAALAGGGLTIAPTPRFALSLRATVVAGFVRHTFVLRDSVRVLESSLVGGRAVLGAEIRMP